MKQTQIILCVGSGGVGKTTVASVLGVHHALLGQKTLVITIDPAQRLLGALGIRQREYHPKKVDLTLQTKQTPKKEGALFAFMPDLKHEWMDFLKAAISHDAVRNEIAHNHFYHYVVDGLPGSLEIICSHILFRLMEKAEFDVIILDTPPSSHSISFFDVPEKIIRVLEQGAFKKMIQKRNSILLRFTKKLAFISGGLLQQTLERLIGSHFLSELIDFSLTVDGLYEPMLERAKAMERMLKDKKTQYVLVLRPKPASVTDGVNFKRALKTRGIALSKIVVNQVMPVIDKNVIEAELNQLPSDFFNNNERQSLHELLSWYVNLLEFENNLLMKIKDHFSAIDCHTLFMNTSMDRANLMAALLQNYERISCAS